MHSLASSSTTDSEIMKEPLKIAEQPEQNVTPSSSNNSVDRGRKRRECKAKVDALELEQAEEKLRRKQQQAEQEVAQKRLLLPHYYQQNLNERLFLNIFKFKIQFLVLLN